MIRTGPTNPSFDIQTDEAAELLEQMADRPAVAERPIIVAGGYAHPSKRVAAIAGRVRRWFTDDAVVHPVSFTPAISFETCRRHLLDVVAGITDQPVDVIGISMGGLVSRYASIDPLPDAEDAPDPRADGPTPRRLRIARLLTLSSPHRGAKLAWLPVPGPQQAGMRPDSPLMQHIRAHADDVDYELVTYTRLHDRIVGPRNAAPPGRVAHWVPNRRFELAHFQMAGDPRLLADIARRLRGEPPLTTDPPAPLPG
jgi:hypothetical protein